MKENKKVLEKLPICPQCHGKLARIGKTWLVCTSCNRAIFMPKSESKYYPHQGEKEKRRRRIKLQKEKEKTNGE